jgi:hypothetical protein
MNVPSPGHSPPVAGEVILGVDTHRDVHVAVALSTLGVVMGTASIPATAVGYRELWEWVSRLGTVRRAGVEGAKPTGECPAVRFPVTLCVRMLMTDRLPDPEFAT